MEKFSQFQALSVNPFVTSPEGASLGTIALRSAIALLKSPFALVAVALLFLTSSVSALLPSGLRSWWRATAVRFAARLVLYCLGVWSIKQEVLEKHCVRSRPSPSQPAHTVEPSDVIVSNHCSWVDAIVLAALYAPQHARTSLEGGLRLCTVVEAAEGALRPLPGKLGPSPAETVRLFVTDAAHSGCGPLLVFPEGATTNNRAVLAFGPVAAQLCDAVTRVAGKKRPTVHVVALQYGAGSGVPFVAGNAWLHALMLLGSISTPVAVLRLPRGHDPQPGDFSTGGSSGGMSGSGRAVNTSAGVVDSAAAAAWGPTVQALLAQMLIGARAIPSGAAEHAQFVRLYSQKQ